MENYQELVTAIEVIDKVRLAKGKKKEIILRENKNNAMLKRVLWYCYNPNLKFKMSKKSIKPIFNETSKWNNLFTMLDELNSSNINNNLKNNVNKFLGSIDNEHTRETIIMIILKDLKLKVGVVTINKAFGVLIEDFQVMKAKSWNDKTKDSFIKKAKKSGYIMTVKENGERGIVIKEGGNVIIKSRQNQLYLGLSELVEAFKKYMPDNMVYEGELLAYNPNGGEWENSEDQFKLTNKILHTLGEKTGIYIKLFDMIPLKDFNIGECEKHAEERKRQVELEVSGYQIVTRNDLIQCNTVLYEGTDTDMIQPILEEVSKTREGCMVILADSIYEAKRVGYHLKCKLWMEADLKVIGVKESKERPGEMGSLIVDYKGTEQGVSGFSDELKELWWNNPSLIIGKIIEVKYKAITKDKDGGESLQFCSFVRVRDDKDEENYE